jgi:predicted esterase
MDSERAFREFRSRVFQLYQQGNFDQAVREIAKMGGNFPDHEARILNWNFSLLAVSKRVDEALEVFQKAIKKGYWYPVEALRKDEDLSNLQQLPEFGLSLSICEKRQKEAMRDAGPERMIIQPVKSFSPHYPLVIVFHGRNANLNESASYWKDLVNYGWMIALLQSSQVIGVDSFCWDDRELAVKETRQQFDEIIEGYSIDPDRIILSGFSQGGGLAIWLVLQRKIPAAGFIAVSPYLAEVKQLTNREYGLTPDASLRSPKGYLVTGDRDEHQSMFDDLEILLQTNGIEFIRERHTELGHEYPGNFSESFLQAVGFIVKA